MGVRYGHMGNNYLIAPKQLKIKHKMLIRFGMS
jgi:hypothetical protein